MDNSFKKKVNVVGVDDLGPTDNFAKFFGFYIAAAFSGMLLIILIIEPGFLELSIRKYCLINFIVFFVSISFNHFILKVNILSLSQIYILVTFMYTSGLLTLYAFGLAELRNSIIWYNDYYAIIAIKMIIMAVLSFEAGICLAYFHKYENTKINKIEIKDNFSDDLVKLGFILFIIAMTVIIISTLMGSGYSNMFQSGYKEFKLGIKRSDVRYFLTALTWLLPVSVIIFAAGIKTKKQTKFSYLLAIITLAAFFLAGDRGGAFTFLIAFVFTLSLMGKKFSYKKIITGAILMLILIPVIKDLRHQTMSQIVSDGIQFNLEKSPFVRAFSEPGSSFQTLLGTLMIIPETEDYRYGSSYFFALGKLVPNLGSWKPPSISSDIGLTSWITSYMNPGEYGGLGFLQIAEFYVHFGAFGVAAGFLLAGYFLTKVQIKCETGLSDRRWVAINGCFLCFLLIWIRNDIFNFIRPAAWSLILILGWTFLTNWQKAKNKSFHLTIKS